jgi:glycosyltransferase involved in cell wall biosynthesis
MQATRNSRKAATAEETTVTIVHIITSTNVGGAQMMLYRHLRTMGDERSAHSVISLMPIGPLGRSIAALGLRVFAPDRPGSLAFIRFQLQIPGLLASLRPDTIHCWMYHACLCGLWARRASGLETAGLIWGVHHSLSDLEHEKPVTRLVIRTLARTSRYADAIVYCSAISRAQHEGLGFAADRSATIENAVDSNEFQPDPAAGDRIRSLAGIAPARAIIGNVARAHPMKDHISFVRTIHEIVMRGRDVHGVIIGEGHEGGPACRLADEIGIADRLSLVGLRGDVAALTPGFDVFLLSSRWGETFGIAVAEAMSAGVPCVVTDIGDCASLVGETGLVARPGDVPGMADAVISLLDLAPAARRQLGQQARRRVRDHFTIERYVERTANLYRNTTAQRLSPSGSGAPGPSGS